MELNGRIGSCVIQGYTLSKTGFKEKNTKAPIFVFILIF